MFNEEELERALRLQSQALGLLKWLAKGNAALGFRHDPSVDQAQAFGLWAWTQHGSLPMSFRPARREDAVSLGVLVASYLECSFDWTANPGSVLYSPDAHCFCPMCSWMVRRPRLRPKQVRRPHKLRAQRLEKDWVFAVASELGCPADVRVLDEEEWRESLALGAYGVQLLRRVRGSCTVGVANLALWRRFAWTPTGSPKRGYVLRAPAMIKAERRLTAHLLEAA